MIRFVNVKNKMFHYLKLKRWLKQKEVLVWYEGNDQNFTYQKIKNKFKEKIINNNITAVFIVLNNKKIGYLQFYPLNSELKNRLNYDQSLLLIGFDLFLSKQYQNQGLGKIVILDFIAYLKSNKVIYNKLIIDPLANNTRAIKCYKSCNFTPVKLLNNYQLHNGIYQDVLIFEFSNN